MEPRIQYAKTSDGVNIAYWAMGSGQPLILMRPETASHLVNELSISELRGFYDRLAEGRTLVRYDRRGCGLSTRDIDDCSYNALLADLLNVIGALGHDQVDVLSLGPTIPLAILFAARHPERLRRLVALVGDSDSTSKVRAFRRALEPLFQDYWEDFCKINMHLVVGWEHSDLAARLAAAYQHSTTPQHALLVAKRDEEFDYEALIPLVQAPTLVLGRLGGSEGPIAGVGRIAGAQIAPVPRGLSSYLVDWEPHVTAIVRFLDDGSDAPTDEGAGAELKSGTAIILFADIADSTALTERLGDAAFREKARGLDETMRAAIRENGGTPVEGKTLGDGVLAVFTSARQAITCAQACHEAARAARLSLHAGIHAGDVIREADPDGRDNVYGGAVNIASRISALSAAGETLVSSTVRDLARTSAGVSFEDRGEQPLKGVGEPVRVWAVRESGA